MPSHFLNSLSILCLIGVVIATPAHAENGTAPKGANTPLGAAQPSAPPRLPVPPAARPTPPLAAAPAAEQPAADPAAPQLKPGELLLNFQAADIQAVVKAVAQMTTRNFLLDPRVKGQITIISAKPVTSQAAYQIFLSALKAQGFTAVEGIGHTRIVPTTEAKTSADVFDQPHGGEKIMTHVLVVQYSSPTQMIPLLRPLMAPTSQIAAYDPANALIITDYADNIRRLIRIVEKIDQPVSSEVTILALKHASALDLADLVARLSLPSGVPGVPGAAPQAAGDRFTIIPDMRTNSLLVRADNPGRVNQIRSLVEKLDVPATRGGHTRVVYLRNADAVKLAEVLRGLIAGEARAQQTAASAAPALPGAARPAASAAGSGRAEASLVQADEATNALIINAPDATYNNLRAVIEKLDVRRTQVYVEAMIVEMSTDKALELGVQWSGAANSGSGAVFGGQNFPNANPSINNATANPGLLGGAGGLLLGYIGESINLPDGTVIRSLGALARALEQRNLANVLSTPNLMTLDNAEAKIVVGQNVPFVTGSFASPVGTPGGGAAPNPFQTIERKDVGLTLKIKPQVSEGGLLKLDIFQEISSVAPTSGTGASDLITNKRSIETKVLVDDGHTIVLGGLIEDSRTLSEQSVPFLGAIPFIGSLFKYTQKTGKRTNLMVFLRPTILYGPTDTHTVTTDRYQHLRALNRDKSREATFERHAPVAPDHKPNKDKDPRRREDSDKAPPAAEKSAVAPTAEAAPATTPEAPPSDSP